MPECLGNKHSRYCNNKGSALFLWLGSLFTSFHPTVHSFSLPYPFFSMGINRYTHKTLINCVRYSHSLTQAYMQTYVHTRPYIQSLTYIYTYTRTYTHVHTYICTRTHGPFAHSGTGICSQKYVHTCAPMNSTLIHTYVHLWTHSLIHTHIHTEAALAMDINYTP